MDGLVLLEFRAQRRAVLLEPLVMGVFFHVEVRHVLVEIRDHICAVRSRGVMVRWIKTFNFAMLFNYSKIRTAQD